MKILAIDDNNDNLISLRAIIKDAFPDSQLITTTSGSKGIDLASVHNPDVILLDIIMPVMDGFEVCRQLKADKTLAQIPVVFLTALGSEKQSRIKALEVGAEAFLAKPIDEAELTAQIRAMSIIKMHNQQKIKEKEHLTLLVEERTRDLQKSHELLTKLTEQVPGVVYQYRLFTDGRSCFPYASPGIIDIYDVTPEEVREDATPVFGRIHPDDYDHITRSIQDSAKNQHLYHSEFRVILPGKGVQWRLCDAKPELLEDGSTLWYGIISDITERKEAEEQLRESEERFRHITSSISDISYSCVVDSRGKSTLNWLYGASEKMTGYTNEEIIKLKCWGRLVTREYYPLFESQILNVLPGKSNVCQLRLKKKDGNILWVHATAECARDKDSGFTVIYGCLVDITERKLAEYALSQSNELNKSLIQTIPFGMDIVDEQGNVLFISENLKKILGPKTIGQKCWTIYKNEKTQCKSCPLFDGINIGETGLFESSGTDGKTFQISYTGMMFQGKKAMLMILQDITDKKEVDKRVRLLAHSLESISECVSVTDNNDILIYVNKSFLHTYGYTAEELIGQPTSLLRAPDIAIEHVRDILPETIEGGWRGEIMNRKKDGTLFPILLSTSIIRNEQGKPIALIGVALDITEMRKSRAELIKAKEQAVESNNLKTAFLNNMSHEIRTPMNHIIGFSSLMADAIGEDKDTYAEIIQKSSNQLLSLIENVILLSRLQSEKMEIVNHELNPELLLSNIARMFDSSELHNDVKIHLQIPENQKNLTILADHEKIRLVLINLTSNAVKYTFKGSVELSFSATENEITFVVSDSGIGIPVHEQEKIFESFYRGEEALHLVIGGTGLGLSIVRELVKTMGGNIGLSSSPGKGSRFFFTIPFKQVESIQQAYEEPVPIQSSRNDLTILVVDDEMINYLYLEILLKSSIRKIDHARNGQEAIEMARKNNYDMILMDLKMPGINGFDATSIIRNSNPQIPIIAQTAYATHEDMEKALLAGCNDLISKPIRKEVLMEMIAKYR